MRLTLAEAETLALTALSAAGAGPAMAASVVRAAQPHEKPGNNRTNRTFAAVIVAAE